MIAEDFKIMEKEILRLRVDGLKFEKEIAELDNEYLRTLLRDYIRLSLIVIAFALGFGVALGWLIWG